MNMRSRDHGFLKWASCFVVCLSIITIGMGGLRAQLAVKDPGPRGGPAGAGGFFPTLDSNEQAFFKQTLARFGEIDSVSGTISGEAGVGLGPTFNGNSCAMCHAQPAVGGSSPGLTSPQNAVPNPQVALATLDGAINVVPSFITTNGPVREARFISSDTSNPYAPLDGGVHGLYTITGRTDAPGCNLAQPDFNTQLANNNVIFRIPTPLFGLGLVENTPDATLQANLQANQAAKAALGISGHFNTSGNDGTITRFGWKAQNKSLMMFAGEAYNVEQGVTNEVFGNERSGVAGCIFNATPEDSTNIVNPNDGTSVGTASVMSSDVVNFAAFARLTAPPAPVALSQDAQEGKTLFGSVGCVLCHSSSLTTAASPFTGMSNVTYHPYSDFALHHMGSNLADGIDQGNAAPDEFRTAPLWGVGQRLFFLHDGRTTDLLQAIEAHFSPGNVCVTTQDYQQFQANGVYFQPFTQSQTCGSEANGVVNNFNSLTADQQQDILDFLRSL
ncbi:MAG: di-heme oxidoredictase family protein [Candidatus Acidiferrales bacterium]